MKAEVNLMPPTLMARWLLLQAIREARSSRWSLLESSGRLAEHAHGDVTGLKAARVLMRKQAPDQLSRWQARALAALSIAIADVSQAQDPELHPPGPHGFGKGDGASVG